MKKVVIMVALAIAGVTITSCSKESAASKVNQQNVEAAKERDANSKLDPPKIEWNKTEHDFGKLKQGDKVETVFTLTNIGDSDLVITNAKGSCGCTVPQWPREAVAPGTSADIKVVFNSAGKRNNAQNTVTLTTNTEKGTEQLRIKAFVEVPAK
ncbi:DUF1573 domain-containing protein [Urechidicola sp. KH5]